eukprot:CAMPEP_0170482998 /NCGR_PEP_ID=MMETSP0208-20121228/2766_1 /TAXON_ID=197538 /ORGANISM="Strombidium inclinatum, Strain S3" /LENGTH=131 /DNA_ID=CAMNT_0010755895 /DNA_START=1120 /DNA_END=1515 /DNA_ORIENTATION=+
MEEGVEDCYVANLTQIAQRYDSVTDQDIRSMLNWNLSSEQRELEWRDLFSSDFFGLWRNKSMMFKRLQTIEQYRYLYRFSIDKMLTLVDDKFILLILLQYLVNNGFDQFTREKRFTRNANSYKRAFENIFN